MNSSDLFKTRRFIHQTLGDLKGWQIQFESLEDPEMLSVTGISFYLFDVPTQWLKMYRMPLSCWMELKQKAKAEKVPLIEFRGLLGQAMTAQATGREWVPDPVMEANQQLGLLAGLYAMSTQTYQTAKGFPEGGHFAVLHYRHPAQDRGVLRPFAFLENAPLLDSQILKTQIQQVITLDYQKHPEWQSL